MGKGLFILSPPPSGVCGEWMKCTAKLGYYQHHYKWQQLILEISFQITFHRFIMSDVPSNVKCLMSHRESNN